MSEPYEFRIPVAATITYTDETGTEQTVTPEAKEVVEIQDPCAALSFFRAAMEKERISHAYGMSDQSAQEVITELKEACNDTHAAARGDVTEEEVPEEEESEAVPSETGSDEEPKGGETTESLNPPGEQVDDEATGVGVSTSERAPGESDGRPLARQHRDPQNPMPEYDIVTVLRNQGASPAEQRDALQRVRRNDPPPGQPHPDHGRDRLLEPTTEADPVDVFGGRYVRTETDVTIPSRGFDIAFTRTYRSGPDYFGPFGFNWDHSYNQYLRPLDNGDVAVWTGRLAEDVYTRQADGTFEPPTGVARRLDHEPGSGTEAPRYVLEDRQGRKRIFSRPDGYPLPDRIPIVRIEDEAGNVHDLEYDAEGRLASVSDHASRALTFDYGDCGLLEQVSDHTGRTWEYRHGPQAELLCEVGKPTTAEHPDGPTIRYEYDRDFEHPALQHNLTRVIDENGDQVLENEFSGDPTSEDFGRVVRQYAEGSQTRFSAERIRAVPEIPEAVNIPATQVSVVEGGNLIVYTFNYRGDRLDERFRLSRDGSARLVARTIRYDERGNPIDRREPNGLGVETDYDTSADDPRAWANPLERVLRAPPASGATDRRVFSASYEDRFHRPKTITAENGETTTFVYEYEVSGADHGKLRRIEYPDATLPDGSSQSAMAVVEHDDFGRPVAIETPAGHRHEFEYHTAGPGDGLLATERRDVGGAEVEREYEYDRWGTIGRVIDDAGGRVDIDHDKLGRLVRRAWPAVDGERATERYRHNPDGSVRRVEAPRGDYDDDVIDDPYLAHEFDYDCLGRLTGASLGVNTARTRHYRYEYDGAGNLVTMDDPAGTVTEFQHDERGRVLERTDAAETASAATTGFVYDRNGNRRTIVDPAGRPTDVEYDPFDRVQSVRHPGPDGERTTVSYEYGPADRVEAVTVEGVAEPGGARSTLSTRSLAYDERGRPIERTVGDVTQKFWFDADDRLVKQIGPQGGETTFAFDGLDRLTQRADPIGNTRQLDYDGQHGPTGVTDVDVAPDGSTETYRRTLDRDARGRPTTVTGPLGNATRFTHDARSHVVAVEFPDDRTVTNSYDLAGNLVERTDAAGTAAAATHQWRRDGLGRVLEYVNPTGTSTNYAYTPHGQLRSITYTDGTERGLTYANGTVLERETRPDGTVVEYGYDAAGRVDRLAFDESATVESTSDLQLVYDGLDRPIRLMQGSLTLDRTFDERGRLRSESIGGDDVSLDYDDTAGTVDLTYPDGRVDRHSRDEAGRLTAVTLQNVGSAGLTGSLSPGDDLVTYEYVGRDRVARRQLANGTETSYDYDGSRRPRTVSHEDDTGDSIATLQYAYGPADRRSVRHGESPLDSVRYEYDAHSRLRHRAVGVSAGEPPVTVATQADVDDYIDAVDPGSADRREQFSLNAADDRLERTVEGPDGTLTETFDVDPMHRIRTLDRTPDGATTTHTFEYAADGRLLVDDRHEYRYDALGRVVEILDASGSNLATFEYDPAGRVRERQVDGTTTTRTSLGIRPLQETDETDAADQQYLYGTDIGGPVVRSDGTNTWAHLDPRGSLLATTDDGATVSQRYEYSAFGVPSVFEPDGSTPGSPTDATMPPRFAGHDLLGDTGLYTTPNRLYDPVTGRFTSRDPNGYLDAASPYPYAANDPVNNVDPTGGAIFTALGIVVAGAALGGAVEAGRQLVEKSRGHRREFDWGRVGIGAAAGGILAPALVAAPELAIPLAGVGVASGVSEFAEGRPATGAYDITFAVMPFGSKAGRAATMGKGTLVGSARGLGRADPVSIRANRLTGGEFLPSRKTRATHFTTIRGLRGIREQGTIRQSPGQTGISALKDGRQAGVWVTPGSARQVSAGQRLLTGRGGLSTRFFVEFDVNPATMQKPGGLMRLYSPVQRQIREPVDLRGRNPEFGEITHWSPVVLSPAGAWPGRLGEDLDADRDGSALRAEPPSVDPVAEPGGLGDGPGGDREFGLGVRGDFDGPTDAESDDSESKK